MDQPLHILSQALEFNRDSQTLWIIYLILFHTYITDDSEMVNMLQHATKNAPHSHLLWLLSFFLHQNTETYEKCIQLVEQASLSLQLECSKSFEYEDSISEGGNDAQNFDEQTRMRYKIQCYKSAALLDMVLSSWNLQCESSEYRRTMQCFSLLLVIYRMPFGCIVFIFFFYSSFSMIIIV